MKYKVFRFTAYVIEIVVFFVIQQMPGFSFQFLGVRPVILIPIATTIATFEDETPAIVFGTVCGVLLDFGLVGSLSLNTFVVPLVCYILKTLYLNVLQVNFLTSLLTSSLSVIIISGIQFAVKAFSYGKGRVIFMLLNKCLPRIGYTCVLIPFFYLINRTFFIHMSEKDNDVL